MSSRSPHPTSRIALSPNSETHGENSWRRYCSEASREPTPEPTSASTTQEERTVFILGDENRRPIRALAEHPLDEGVQCCQILNECASPRLRSYGLWLVIVKQERRPIVRNGLAGAREVI